jgi:NitT/TauT family transport system substrate-binding protein
VRIAIGGQAQLIYLAATLAEELGYCRDAGVAVSLIDFPGGAKALEAVLGGSADVVCGFYDHTIQMAAQGRDLRAFVAMLRYPGLVLVAASPGINRIEDLKGRTVGVSAAGSSTHLLLNHLLVTHGLKPDDASTASIGMSATAVAAITRGKVDAAIMTDPALAIARKQLPSLRILADTRNRGRCARRVRSRFISVRRALFNARLAGRAPRIHRSLARAILRTLEWMRSHSAEEIRARMPASFRTDDPEMDLEGLRSLQNMLSPDGRITPESAAAVQQVLRISLDAVRARTRSTYAPHTAISF